MPGNKPITPAQRDHYFTLRQRGWSQSQAAPAAGFSLASGKRLEGDARNAAQHLAVKNSSRISDTPIAEGALTDAVQSALADTTGVEWMRRYFGMEMSRWQKHSWQAKEDAWANPDRSFVVENVAPGLGKSTGLVGFAAKLIAVDRSTRGLFISRARSLAVRNTLRLRRMLERVTPVEGAQATLAGDFGRFRADIGGDIWTQDAFVVVQADGSLIEEKEPTCSAFGFDSEWLGNRLNWVFGDDLDSTRGIVNIDIVERNREVFDNELEPRLEPGGMFYLAQQRLGAYDFSSHVLAKRSFPDDPEELGDLTANFEDDPDKDGTRQYDHVVFKAHYDELCLGRETHKPGAPSWPDGCLLDPLRLSWKDLRKAMSKPYYRTVYQQEDPVETEALVQKIWIEGGDGHPGCWDKDRDIWQIPPNLMRPLMGVITVDPSPTRFWSVQAWVVGPHMESRYLVDLFRGRMEAPDFLDWSSMLGYHTGLVEDWRYNFQRMGVPLSHVIVEINAAQRFMLQYEHFQTWQRNHSVRIIPHSTQRTKSDPEFGIQALAPHWEHGHVRLPGAGQGRITSMPLVREVLRWPHAPSDDCVLSEWFLEFNLAQIQRRARATRGGVVDPRRPSWAVA